MGSLSLHLHCKMVNHLVWAAQAGGRAFGTPEELLQTVDLYNLTQRSFKEEVEVRRCPCLRKVNIEALHGMQWQGRD